MGKPPTWQIQPEFLAHYLKEEFVNGLVVQAAAGRVAGDVCCECRDLPIFWKIAVQSGAFVIKANKDVLYVGNELGFRDCNFKAS
jgi:hypothetical protein